MATTNAQSAYVIFMKTRRVFIKTNLLDAKHFPISFIKVGSAAIMDADGLLKNTSAEGAICKTDPVIRRRRNSASPHYKSLKNVK